MDDKQLFIIFSIIVIVSLVIDFRGKYKKCISDNPKESIPIIIFHRIIHNFVYFGWLFNNKIILYIYLLLILILLIHWATNEWKCCLTQYENEICDFPENTQYDVLLQHLRGNTKKFAAIATKLIMLSITIIKSRRN